MFSFSTLPIVFLPKSVSDKDATEKKSRGSSLFSLASRQNHTDALLRWVIAVRHS